MGSRLGRGMRGVAIAIALLVLGLAACDEELRVGRAPSDAAADVDAAITDAAIDAVLPDGPL